MSNYHLAGVGFTISNKIYCETCAITLLLNNWSSYFKCGKRAELDIIAAEACGFMLLLAFHYDCNQRGNDHENTHMCEECGSNLADEIREFDQAGKCFFSVPSKGAEKLCRRFSNNLNSGSKVLLPSNR